MGVFSIGMAKQSGVKISFIDFMKTSALITLVTLCVASAYLSLYLWLSL